MLEFTFLLGGETLRFELVCHGDSLEQAIRDGRDRLLPDRDRRPRHRLLRRDDLRVDRSVGPETPRARRA